MPPGKVIATILGIVLLVGSVVAGVLLVQRRQELRRKAANQECLQSLNCVLLENPGESGSYTVDKAILDVYLTTDQVRKFNEDVKEDGCYKVLIEGDNLNWQRIGPENECKDIINIQIWLSGSPLPTTPPVSAKCLDIKIYDTNWNRLNEDEIRNLGGGSTIRITVSGSASYGNIDQARFIVNGTTRNPVTNKKPGTQEFYEEYTIPSGLTNLTIKAQLHHSEAGWF